MRLETVTGTPIILQCLNCKRRGHSDGKAGHAKQWFADLDGTPYMAYYCDACAALIRALPEATSK